MASCYFGVLPMIPSADDVARAIVAACRETGEDPVSLVEGDVNLHARHYAFHALLHVFPSEPLKGLARMLGDRRPVSFWNRSYFKGTYILDSIAVPGYIFASNRGVKFHE